MLKLPYEELPVKTVDSPTKEQFLELVQSAEEPFKVTGSIDHWLLSRILSQLQDPIDKCDYLASLASNEQVSYTVMPAEQKGAMGFNEKLEQNFSLASQKALFPEFMQQVKKYLLDPNAGNLYLQSTPIKDLNNKLGCLDLFKGFAPITQARFWIGTGSQTVSLHNDPYRNIIAIFTGRKRIIMFPPKELPNLYPAPFDKRIAGVIGSLVNAYNPDFNKFPLFAKALEKVKVAVIKPGEFVYIPPLWWHAVEGEGFNVGLNCWFFDENKADKLSSLYVPAESLMLDINLKPISDIRRKQLYNKFIEVIESDDNSSKLNDKLELSTIKEAGKIKSILNEAVLSTEQKNLWKQWVKVFADHYIYCLHGNPFPTLPGNEHDNMVKRLQKSKWHRLMWLFRSRLFLFIQSLKEKKNEVHGMVPF